MTAIYLALGPITFLAPLTLIGLILLPLIWWILRVTPPSPKKQIFPPLRILQNVVTEEETPHSTPLWLLLFRLLLAAIIAFALARPILFQPEGISSRPAAILIDDGWDNAANWADVMREAEARISDARRRNVDVLLAASHHSGQALSFGPAQDAMRYVKTLRPAPLPTNHQNTAKRLKDIDLSGSDVIWLSSGVDFGGGEALGKIAVKSAKAVRLSPAPEATPLMPGVTEETAGGFRSVWHRLGTKSLRQAEITAHDRDGSVISRANIDFAPGSKTGEAAFELPSELRSRVTALRVSGLASAGSVKLLDDSWGRPLIGILTPKTSNSSPLLSEPFYAKTALAPYADIHTGSLDDILPLSPSIIIMPDAARTEVEELKTFVETGGLLIRFAGPRLAKRSDELLPVELRAGGRELGGALTWEDPQGLAPFSDNSPFYGLKIPDDIRVKRQVMAQPSALTDSRTWARLEDGSPLVTSAQQGFGRIVLFHVTAGPEWSNLPVDGLYVDMLRRMLSMARAAPAGAKTSGGDWAPERVLTGFGRLGNPSIKARPIPDEDFAAAVISETTPPGLYRQGARRRALNTVTTPQAVSAMPKTEGISLQSYGQTKERTLGGLWLGIAMTMLALDALFALIVSGRMSYLRPKRRSGVLAAFMIAGLFITAPDALAQIDLNSENALDLHFAYIETGNTRTDQMSEAAMEGLVSALNRRTTIEPVGVRGVTPGLDPLVFYPFLYWPINSQTPAPPPEAVKALNAYMAAGGTLVLDTQDAGDRGFLSGTAHPSLTRVTKNLDIPSLTPVPTDHVLTKSFYLIQVYPGRWANGPVWVDRQTTGAARDGVSSVIIGSNDWASGWAMDETGRPLQSLERDIPNQQEMSLRFGVNLAMYALAGNYKSDQVHAATLIERIGQNQREIENLGPDDSGRKDEPK